VLAARWRAEPLRTGETGPLAERTVKMPQAGDPRLTRLALGGELPLGPCLRDAACDPHTDDQQQNAP
jgi:hypothetical protein